MWLIALISNLKKFHNFLLFSFCKRRLLWWYSQNVDFFQCCTKCKITVMFHKKMLFLGGGNMTRSYAKIWPIWETLILFGLSFKTNSHCYYSMQYWRNWWHTCNGLKFRTGPLAYLSPSTVWIWISVKLRYGILTSFLLLWFPK